MALLSTVVANVLKSFIKLRNVLKGGLQMNLTKTLLNNPGLRALTLPSEQKEITAMSFGVAAKAARKRRIVFAHMQSDFQGGFIPYWHVVDSKHPSYMSTLSMEGLYLWHVL